MDTALVKGVTAIFPDASRAKVSSYMIIGELLRDINSIFSMTYTFLFCDEAVFFLA